MAAAADPLPTPTTQTGYTLLGLLSFGRELSGYELKQLADEPAVLLVGAGHEPGVPRGRAAVGGRARGPASVVREGNGRRRCTGSPPRARGGAGVAGLAARAPRAAPPGGAAGVLRAPARRRGPGAAIEAHRAWCDRMLAELGAVRAGLGDDELFRYAALVAEWGLGYYRGERAAAAGVARAMGDCPDAATAAADDGPGSASDAPELAG